MGAEEYRKIWKEAIRLCELEQNEDEATSFVWKYHRNCKVFASMDDKTLLLTFVGLVVYEQKFHIKQGSTTPTSRCYWELLGRANNGSIDKEFIYDVGDWAADYSDNDYIPMGHCRGFGPRKYYKFWEEYQTRVWEEKEAARIRKEILLEEGRKKVEAAKRKHQERLNVIQQLRDKSVDESILTIEQSYKPVFYYIELIEDWFKTKSLSGEQREKILSMFPLKSTRHNNRIRKYLESISEL